MPFIIKHVKARLSQKTLKNNSIHLMKLIFGKTRITKMKKKCLGLLRKVLNKTKGKIMLQQDYDKITFKTTLNVK